MKETYVNDSVAIVRGIMAAGYLVEWVLILSVDGVSWLVSQLYSEAV